MSSMFLLSTAVGSSLQENFKEIARTGRGSSNKINLDKQNSQLIEITPWQVFTFAFVGIMKMGLSDCSMIIFPSKAFILQCLSLTRQVLEQP